MGREQWSWIAALSALLLAVVLVPDDPLGSLAKLEVVPYRRAIHEGPVPVVNGCTLPDTLYLGSQPMVYGDWSVEFGISEGWGWADGCFTGGGGSWLYAENSTLQNFSATFTGCPSGSGAVVAVCHNEGFGDRTITLPVVAGPVTFVSGQVTTVGAAEHLVLLFSDDVDQDGPVDVDPDVGAAATASYLSGSGTNTITYLVSRRVLDDEVIHVTGGVLEAGTSDDVLFISEPVTNLSTYVPPVEATVSVLLSAMTVQATGPPSSGDADVVLDDLVVAATGEGPYEYEATGLFVLDDLTAMASGEQPQPPMPGVKRLSFESFASKRLEMDVTRRFVIRMVND